MIMKGKCHLVVVLVRTLSSAADMSAVLHVGVFSGRSGEFW